MTVDTYQQAQLIQEKIRRLISIREEISKNPFIITQNGKTNFNSLGPENLIKNYLPLTNEQYNRDFLSKINSSIEELNKKFKEL